MPEENADVAEVDAPVPEMTKKEARAVEKAAEEVVVKEAAAAKVDERKEARAVAAKKLIDAKAVKTAARLAAMPMTAKSGRRLSKADALYARCVVAVAKGSEVIIRDIGGLKTVVDIDNP